MRTQQGTSAWVPQHHRDITLQRLEGFATAERWHSDVNIRQCLYTFRSSEAVTLEVWDAPGLTRPSFSEAVQQQFVPCKVGQSFGPSWSTHWFRVKLCVPDTWSGSPPGAPLLFAWDSGSEAMVWSEDGQPRQGITDSRNEYRVADNVEPGATYTLYVEMACNGVGGCSDTLLPPPTDRRYTLRVAQLVVPNLTAQALLSDFMVIWDIAKSLPAESAAAARALYVANQMVNTFRADEPSSWAAARQLAAEVLQTRGASTLHKVTAVGHCHIDTGLNARLRAGAGRYADVARGHASTARAASMLCCAMPPAAWLWPFEETHRKVARSWVSQLRLMEQYPLFKFAASSAQQYAWLKADYPDLFKEVQQAAQAGRFIPVGGAWVEMDTNLPGGESLVRQLLYGQRFFEANFGNRCDVFWLPDTFGYAAQLPQLVHDAGMRYFLTQKLSWNNINAFPHSTFWWQALDGTKVLTHFPPSNTYGSQVSVSDLMASVNNHKDKDRSPCSLLLFGNGDGGGGPTHAHCEALVRLADAEGKGIDGLVQCVPGEPSQFFQAAEAGAQDLLTWKGELYFELHRGTYTSHADNKMFNRRMEGLLRDAELLGAMATLTRPDYSYPRDVIDKLWQDTLLFQFHDVLPGSSIQLVYNHTAARYPNMVAEVQTLRDAAAAYVLSSQSPSHAAVHQKQSASTQTQPNAGGFPGPQQPAAVRTTGIGAASAGVGVGVGTWTGARGMSHGKAATELEGLQESLSYLDVHGARYPAIDTDTVLSSMPTSLSAPPQGLRQAAASGVWLFNSLSCSRVEVVEVPSAYVPGDVHVAQWSQAGLHPGSALVSVAMAPLSFTDPFSAAATSTAHALSVGDQEGVTACMTRLSNGSMVYQLMNRFVRAQFDSQGRLVSLLDRLVHRELVPQQTTTTGGADQALGNKFRMFEDQPLFWDAWDIEIYHLEKAWDAGTPSTLEIIESGPVRATLQYSCKLSEQSSLKQTIQLSCTSACLEFSTIIQWHENRKVLKVEFPWGLTSDNATYEVQFGAVSRPTHQNTSWDWARFEVCGHKWADLSEPDYGVALLNDCKYGHATHGNIQRLTLLRSPKAPDETTDMGVHHIRYAVWPHTCGWQSGGVVAAGLAFNSPPLLCGRTAAGMTSPLPAVSTFAGQPFIKVEYALPAPCQSPSGPLVLDTMKLPEPSLTQEGEPSDSKRLVLRLYEPHGCRGAARVELGWGMQLSRAALCNLLEDVKSDLPLLPAADGLSSAVQVPFSPFKVLTVMLWLS